jgi:Zn-dependent peptidase ImmA (M78 family)
MRKEKIAAEKLMKKFHTNCPFQIAREMGVNILFERLKDTLGYFNTYKRIKTIHINQELTEQDQQFTCAHELAHSVLHIEVNTPFLQRSTLFSVSKIEREANTFAVELLLPDYLLCEHQDISLSQLATICGVPHELMYLKNR